MFQTSTPTHLGWMPHPASHRRLLALVVAAVGASAAVIAITSTVAGTSCATAAGAASVPDIRITALPGVDLTPAASLPGVKASSGPFPTAATSLSRGGRERGVRLEARAAFGAGESLRPGSVVVERGLARALGLAPGRSLTVATASGSRRMQVAGITTT